jgi:hypothetical protein
LNIFHNYLEKQHNDINGIFRIFENNSSSHIKIIDDFSNFLGIKLNEDIKLPLMTRLINLREDGLKQALIKQKLSNKEIENILDKAYDFSASYWIDRQEERLEFIKQNNLFSEFYRSIFYNVMQVGLKMNALHKKWDKLIIKTTNKDLKKQFKSDNKKVLDYLKENNLIDLDNGKIAKRCYSALVKKENNYIRLSYFDAFNNEVNEIINALSTFIGDLDKLKDDTYNQKQEYILYISSLIVAFKERNCDELVSKWSDVDKAWMSITSPVQIGHPLEYYEDHYRKAVAIEWDIRLSNPKMQKNSTTLNNIKIMFKNIYEEIDTSGKFKHIYDFSLHSLSNVQLYISRPAMFFASEFNGLFSAQVVPNDEKVSKQYGKKIFAFSDEVLQISQAKPFLLISKEFLGNDFLKQERNILFKDSELWHKIYDITTIGHEYGHILGCDEDSEAIMNESGNFKNIEEFKATTGGLIAFFNDNTKNTKELNAIIRDIIKRAISLIGWMKVDEVLPYYCEGLIHLSGLFESGILKWDNDKKELSINAKEADYNNIISWYQKTYKDLMIHYFEKKDASIFLNKYAKQDKDVFIPKSEKVESFVKYYYKRYKDISQKIDTTDIKENYL